MGNWYQSVLAVIWLQSKWRKLILFFLLVLWEPLFSLATAPTKVLTPYPPLFLMGNSFCQARCYLSPYYVRQGQRNDGLTSQPCYIVGKKKRGKEELSWQRFWVHSVCFFCVCVGRWQQEDKATVSDQICWSAPYKHLHSQNHMLVQMNMTTHLPVKVTASYKVEPREMERCRVIFPYRNRVIIKPGAQRKKPGRKREGSEEVGECVFLAGSLKRSSLLLPDILRYHGYRLAERNPAPLSASLTLCWIVLVLDGRHRRFRWEHSPTETSLKSLGVSQVCR